VLAFLLEYLGASGTVREGVLRFRGSLLPALDGDGLGGGGRRIPPGVAQGVESPSGVPAHDHGWLAECEPRNGYQR
jgi:hypothetical protein